MTWTRCTDLTFPYLVYFCELVSRLASQDVKSWIFFFFFEATNHFVGFIFLAHSPFFSAACHVELDLSEEAEPGWQPAHQDSRTASISGGAQD